ncbi:MAG: hypothetical protein WC891_07855 [Actinomycetota bacterium]
MKAKDEREDIMQELRQKLAILEAGEIGDDEALELIDECIRLAGECA